MFTKNRIFAWVLFLCVFVVAAKALDDCQTQTLVENYSLGGGSVCQAVSITATCPYGECTLSYGACGWPDGTTVTWSNPRTCDPPILD